MRHLKRFNESFANIGYGDTNDDRIEDNIKDIFVEYKDSNDLDVYVHKGHLPLTVVGLDDNIIEVTLFDQRGLRYNDISVEIDMLIDYMESLTDKIYGRLDKQVLFHWSGGFSGSHNTLELFFVECITPSRKITAIHSGSLDYSKTNESFDEILTNLRGGDFDSWIRIEDNVKDIFVEYQDSNDLDVVVGKGFLPMTVVDSDDDNVIEVKLFAQRGVRFREISAEIGMLIEYMKSLTDNQVKIYYDLDRSGLRHWRPLAGSDNEFDYYLQGKESMSFNTIRIYFVDSVGKKLNESSQEDSKIVDDIDDIFVEMWDSGLTHLVSKDGIFINISILKKRKDTIIDFDLLKDCVEMTKDYLSELGNFKEFYRFGYVSERVTARMTNDGPVYDKKQSRDNIEYSSFPDNWSEDVENKHALEHRFDYELEGIKIRFKQK